MAEQNLLGRSSPIFSSKTESLFLRKPFPQKQTKCDGDHVPHVNVSTNIKRLTPDRPLPTAALNDGNFYGENHASYRATPPALRRFDFLCCRHPSARRGRRRKRWWRSNRRAFRNLLKVQRPRSANRLRLFLTPMPVSPARRQALGSGRWTTCLLK